MSSRRTIGIPPVACRQRVGRRCLHGSATLAAKCTRGHAPPHNVRRRIADMKVLKFLAGPVLTGIVVALAVLWLNRDGPHNGQPGGPPASPGMVTSYADVVARAAPAVVNIYTTQIVTRSNNQLPAPLLEQYMQEPRRERILSSLGSGVIVSPDGYLLTSYHVIIGRAHV